MQSTVLGAIIIPTFGTYGVAKLHNVKKLICIRIHIISLIIL